MGPQAIAAAASAQADVQDALLAIVEASASDAHSVPVQYLSLLFLEHGGGPHAVSFLLSPPVHFLQSAPICPDVTSANEQLCGHGHAGTSSKTRGVSISCQSGVGAGNPTRPTTHSQRARAYELPETIHDTC